MKLLISISLIAILIYSCNEKVEVDYIFENNFGTVMYSNDSNNCETWIKLDDGTILLPTNLDEYNFSANQRIWLAYELIDKQTDCFGEDVIIKSYETFNCIPYTDLYFYNIDSLERDPVTINEVSFDGDCLLINLSYSGGCAEHQIDLARIHPSCGTPPLPPPTFEIRHNANGDMCEAWFTKTFEFDLSPLKAEFDEDVKIILGGNMYGENLFNEELTFKIN
ncbi:NigD1/NigD2 family lipoprotein [Sunxiuqinia sp. A32]|uniref:NigD1/NigD2 family lipoprotein n=1 Tax=Sunxiuqinia sp. A32 TaxID=3461496 RepID=UPI004045DB58